MTGARDVRRVKIKAYSRLDALEKLMRHLGAYEKAQGDPNPIDPLTALIMAINKRGSPPIMASGSI